MTVSSDELLVMVSHSLPCLLRWNSSVLLSYLPLLLEIADMPSIRVDGNDIFAVHDAVAAAREFALRENRPVFIEAMTYRGGHHSTSDDSTRYRDSAEIQVWNDYFSPINRLRSYMESRGLWDSDKEVELRRSARAQVLEVLGKAEQEPFPPASELFTDVYDEIPPHLLRQEEQLHV